MTTQPDRACLQARFGDERVLVVPTSSTTDLPTGVTAQFDIAGLLQTSCYLPRWQAEHAPVWRQLVTYIVVRQSGRLLLTERLTAQSESRLHSLFSIGVGGHVNSADTGDPVSSGWRRELDEELLLDWPVESLIPAALINDLSNAVSRDHLGVLLILDMPADGHVSIRETTKMSGQMLDQSLIHAGYYGQLESWSQLVLDYLLKAQN